MNGRPEETLPGSAVLLVLVSKPEDVTTGPAVLAVDSLQDVEEALMGSPVLVEKVVGVKV